MFRVCKGDKIIMIINLSQLIDLIYARQDGTVKVVRVPEKDATRQINELLKNDREMLRILEKL
jgi:hypothetical protein